MRVLGIDPGAGGAVALVAGAQQTLMGVADMPVQVTDRGRRRVDAGQLVTLVAAWSPIDHAVIELVGPMPRDGSAGSFWFGRSAGICEGVLAALGVSYSLVSPVMWKRRLGVPTNKDAARARASELFGGQDWWPLKKHDGRAEAAMIALWGWMDRVAGTW